MLSAWAHNARFRPGWWILGLCKALSSSDRSVYIIKKPNQKSRSRYEYYCIEKLFNDNSNQSKSLEENVEMKTDERAVILDERKPNNLVGGQQSAFIWPTQTPTIYIYILWVNKIAINSN